MPLVGHGVGDGVGSVRTLPLLVPSPPTTAAWDGVGVGVGGWNTVVLPPVTELRAAVVRGTVAGAESVPDTGAASTGGPTAEASNGRTNVNARNREALMWRMAMFPPLLRWAPSSTRYCRTDIGRITHFSFVAQLA